MLGIIDEMRGTFKEWRHEDAAQRATESTVLDRSLHVLYQPTARSSSQGINTEPISPPTFDSATDWDVVDDGEEEGDLLDDDDDRSEEENEEVKNVAEEIELEKEDENVEDEVIEEGVQ